MKVGRLKMPCLRAALFLCIVGLSSCALPDGGSRWQRTELYFGEVRAKDWDRFLADSVTPRFPSGFTVIEAYGQWRNTKGLIEHEHSRVLVILHARESETEGRIESIRAEFLKRFGQESVLKVTQPATVSF